MSDDINAQLKSYAENKRKEYVAKSGLVASSNRADGTSEQPTERTYLINRGTPSERSDKCFCLRELLKGCWCCTCKCHASSIEVLKLPLTQNSIAVHIHYLWPTFVLLSTFPAFWVSPLYGTYALVLGGPILFTTILLHELGHALMAVHLGGEVDRILLWPLGGVAYISFFGETNPSADAQVAIVGPLTHIPQFLFWYVAMYLSNQGTASLTWPVGWGWDFWLSLCSGAMVMQVVLCLFNLIPAFPLDGGRLLAALLAHCECERRNALSTTAFVGSIFGWYFLFAGINEASASKYAIFTGWNEIFIGLFILSNCFELWQYSAMGLAHQHPGYAPAHPTTMARDRAAPFAASTRHTARTSGGIHRLGDAERERSQPDQDWMYGPQQQYAVVHQPSGRAPPPRAAQDPPKSGMTGAGRKLGSAQGSDAV